MPHIAVCDADDRLHLLQVGVRGWMSSMCNRGWQSSKEASVLAHKQLVCGNEAIWPRHQHKICFSKQALTAPQMVSTFSTSSRHVIQGSA